MPIYLNYDGVQGPVTSSGHEKWIELQSIGFSVGRSMNMISGDLTRRDASTPMINEFPITHDWDDVSINFFDLAVSGAQGKLVKIDCCRTAVGQAAPEVYLHIELEETLVSGYQMSAAGGTEHPSRPVESLSLNFTKITWTYTPLNADNTPGTPVTKGYDLKISKPF